MAASCRCGRRTATPLRRAPRQLRLRKVTVLLLLTNTTKKAIWQAGVLLRPLNKYRLISNATGTSEDETHLRLVAGNSGVADLHRYVDLRAPSMKNLEQKRSPHENR